MSPFVQQLKQSLHVGFIDKTATGVERFQPELIVNEQRSSMTVLQAIQQEFATCNSFIFTVAFITESGLMTLKADLLDLKLRGIRGQIITSTYLYFNQPKMFRELLKLDNVDVRVTALEGFHSKGYIFKQADAYTLIVGSSNLTTQALKVNYEWNLKLTSHVAGDVVDHFVEQFEALWEEAVDVTEQWITAYKELFKQQQRIQWEQKIFDAPVEYSENAVTALDDIQPNAMQQEALLQLNRVREQGKKKALVISATGTGKTYLAAFDVRAFRPKRMLFIVHREQILKKAMQDFKRVLGGHESDFGLYTGNHRDKDAKYVFATIQTLARDTHLYQFANDHFDYILIDEVHKAGAASYRKLMTYFRPDFYFGMTATPDRTDGENIYELFDYTVAYDIRLQDALEANLLAPFHYIGVTAYEMDGLLETKTEQLKYLVMDERIDYILDKINYYGYSGERVVGLMFCSLVEEAEQLSTLLNERGLRTVALSGKHRPEEREMAVQQLENGELDYILTVDIFNEGIDIPSINQIVMLRQTESSIVFIQQLGRGLRKSNKKEFVTVIDFIGNYQKNYLIPIALSGDQSMNKETIRRTVQEPSFLTGVSTIHFEQIAKERIFESINASRLTSFLVIQEAYEQLKNRLGRQPLLVDFIHNHSLDPVVLVDEHDNGSKHNMNSYYEVLVRLKEVETPLPERHQQTLLFLSKECLPGKRPHELLLLEALMDAPYHRLAIKAYEDLLVAKGISFDEQTLRSVERVLSHDFFVTADQKKYGRQPFVTKTEQHYVLADFVQEGLNHGFANRLIRDTIEAGLLRSTRYDATQRLTINEKYSRKDVCRLLNWEKDEKGTMFGYRLKHGTCPIFIKYAKDDAVSASVKYGDQFINRHVLKWYTRNNRTLASKEVRELLQMPEKKEEMHIFVMKNESEGAHYYYLGESEIQLDSVQEETIVVEEQKELPIVSMHLALRQEVDATLYHYITST